MSYVRAGRVDKAVETSTPVFLFIILAMFAFAISPITLLIELYFQRYYMGFKFNIFILDSYSWTICNLPIRPI